MRITRALSLLLFLILYLADSAYSDSFSYIGCYQDSATRDINGPMIKATMTIEKCFNYCSTYVYNFFGVQNAQYCVCGNSYGIYGAGAGCTSSCTGNSSQICGASGFSNVYSITYNPSRSSLPVYDYMGCNKDPNVTDLSYVVYSATSFNSPGSCIYQCQTLGYSYAGVSNGSACLCGNTYGIYGAADSEAECNITCTNDARRKCGAVGRNAIWKTTTRSISPYLGCFLDNTADRDLNGFSPNNTAMMTVSWCQNACLQYGYSYAGVQNGSSCYCGDSYGKYGQSGAVCSTVCTGNSIEMCGGKNSSSIVATNSTKDYSYVGCFGDNPVRDLNGPFIGVTAMTVDVCYAFCSKFSYKYFGVQAQVWCGCGNRYGIYNSSTACTVACGGNSSQICGNGYANSLYKIKYNAGFPKTIDVYNYIGCFKDNSTSRDITVALGGYNYPPNNCIYRCKQLGYSIAGLTNNNCFCGDSYGRYGQVDDSECNATCSSFSNFTCGASLRNSVYSAKELVINGSLGCYLDSSSSRDLNGYSFSSNSMTSMLCINTCLSKGYMYAGVQNSMYCYCGNSYGQYGQSGALCTSYCKGNQIELCGGNISNWVFNASANPSVNITNKNPSPASPVVLNRSATFTLNGSYLFASIYNYSMILDWSVYQIDNTTYSVLSKISFSTANPTQSQLSFTLPGNSLPYGLFKIVFTVNISIVQNGVQFSVQDTTYLQTVPTGITVKVLPNSATNMTVGSLQSFTLDPVSYSVDSDDLLSMSSLSFKFYCRLVNSSQQGVNYLGGGNDTDLNTGISTNNCFNTTNGFYFNQSGNVLTIKPGGLVYSSGLINQFIISTESYGKTYYQIISINVDPQVPEWPVPNIKCHISQFCSPLHGVYIFSTSNIIMVDGSVSSGMTYIDSVTYLWTVLKNTGNATNPIWSQLTTSEKTNLAGTTTDEVTLSSNLFISSTQQWLVRFTIFTTSSVPALNNANFSTSMILQANQKPYNGSCSVDLSTGYALNTNFTITCINWADYDGIVIKYEFFASYANNQSIVNLGNNQTGMFFTTLPAGSTTDSNKLYLFVQVFDNSGAITIYYISAPVVVEMQSATLFSSQSDILSGSSSNPLVQNMNSADVSVASSAIIAYASSFNQIASSNSSSNGSSSLNSSQISEAVQVNALFVNSISKYDTSDLSSIKAVSSVLSVVSSNTELMSADTAQQVGDICAQMTESLVASASQYSLSYIYQAASYILDASANSLQSLNQQSASSATLQAAASQQISLVNTITSITATQLALNGSQNVNKNNINLTITRTSMDTVRTTFETSGSKVQISNPCSIVNLPEGNCSDKVVISQIFSRTNSLVLNTNVNTAGSTSISVSYYNNEMSSYPVTNNQEGFYFWIYRTTQQSTSFTAFNFTNYTIGSTNQLQAFVFTLTTPNQSVTVELMPGGSNANKIGYLVALRYGAVPIISSTSQLFDLIKIFCPSDLSTESGNKFYKLFSNMSANVLSTTTVGYGFRELTSDEYGLYCNSSNQSAKDSLTQAPILPDSFNFTELIANPLSRLVYAAGCYYIDLDSMAYSSWGVEVLPDSNTTHTHCVSTHLTEFAGGLIVLPDSIDFNNVWANASFTQNLTIYLTVIIVSCLYILLFVWCRWMDWKDSKKRQLFLLRDNSSFDLYYYELLVFTGNRRDAGTKSNVSFVMGGKRAETNTRALKPIQTNCKILDRGSVNSFLMSVQKPLGDLNYLRIWHDNSGPGRHASWFLKFVIAHDLQTREKFYFICNDWFALEKSDGQIERILPVATKKQKTDLAYLMEKQTKQKMSDGHLWFSIAARPPESPFTRTDRLTCAFVLLCLTMLMNIMYYGMASSSTGNSLVLGPFSLSQTQIVIGVITNLIIFPPSFLILQIFRKSRRRVSRSAKLKKLIQDNSENKEQSTETYHEVPKKRVKKPRKKFTLPWWFKIIGYALSFCIVVVCLFFIIVKGISFGDNTCKQWLTSFLISVLTSVFLTQPIQVALLSIFFVLLFRKSNDDEDLEYDDSDDGKPINKFKMTGQDTEEEQPVNMKYVPQNSVLLNELKEKRMLENRAFAALRKILFYAIFLTILFQVAYSKTNSNSYNYQSRLSNLIMQNITLVKTTEDMWSWINNQFLESMSGAYWYNQDTSSLKGYIKDYNSYLIHSIMLRQSRSKSISCSTRTGQKVCYQDYSSMNYEHTDYGVGWSQYGTSSSLSDQLKQAFKYTSALSISSQPYAGTYTSYLGGGYVFWIDASSQNTSQIQSDLRVLETNEWVDQKTRAVFIEFTLFNVNLNLFSYCLILFEILPTGSIVITYEFDPMSLYTDESVVIVAFDIVYLFIVVFLMLSEIKLALKLKRKYLVNWWSYVNWLLVAFSWVSFAMYLYRMYEKWSLTSKISKSSEVINFQTIQYWNSLMLVFLALCCALGSVKLLRVFSFSRNINTLSRVFQQVFKEMISFVLLFLILMFAFTQMMYLIVYDRNAQFMSVATSLVTGFLMMIGKFNVDSFCQDAGPLGTIVYCLFCVMMILILLNMFITLLTDRFSKIRKEYKELHGNDDSLLVTYFKSRILPSIMDKLKWGKRTGDTYRLDGQSEYLNTVESFETRADRLINHVNQKQVQSK